MSSGRAFTLAFVVSVPAAIVLAMAVNVGMDAHEVLPHVPNGISPIIHWLLPDGIAGLVRATFRTF